MPYNEGDYKSNETYKNEKQNELPVQQWDVEERETKGMK